MLTVRCSSVLSCALQLGLGIATGAGMCALCRCSCKLCCGRQALSVRWDVAHCRWFAGCRGLHRGLGGRHRTCGGSCRQPGRSRNRRLGCRAGWFTLSGGLSCRCQCCQSTTCSPMTTHRRLEKNFANISLLDRVSRQSKPWQVRAFHSTVHKCEHFIAQCIKVSTQLISTAARRHAVHTVAVTHSRAAQQRQGQSTTEG